MAKIEVRLGPALGGNSPPDCCIYIIQVLPSTKKDHTKRCGLFWQGHKDLNPEPTVLETAALPIELYPYIEKGEALFLMVGPQGFEPGTIRL